MEEAHRAAMAEMGAGLESSAALEDQLEATRAKKEQELMGKLVQQLSDLDARYNAMEHEKASAALEYAEREMREKVTESACACRSYSGSADSNSGTSPAVPVSAV